MNQYWAPVLLWSADHLAATARFLQSCADPQEMSDSRYDYCPLGWFMSSMKVEMLF